VDPAAFCKALISVAELTQVYVEAPLKVRFAYAGIFERPLAMVNPSPP
jgi:hypothetical protein